MKDACEEETRWRKVPEEHIIVYSPFEKLEA
jgi:hypothetical protein